MTAVISIIVVIRRVLVERQNEKAVAAARAKRAAEALAAAPAPDEHGGIPATPPTELDDWFANHTRPSTKPRPGRPLDGGNL